ncbi:MAG TPA: hypothetical protein VNV36_06210 [Pseudomonas sp.]|uniref:hypothetical protein n=1 Tax=Pseudomonas sp. TaxID=306 RepID=UPI002CFC772C|nr:hypothetical protein [Pseudomonas sp.]HWH86349.1 hypothetical protein [Pseudomonas sp.]
MAALTRDRNTPRQDANLVAVPVEASTKIHAGSLVVANAAGYAAPGTTSTVIRYIGRAEETVDNTGGARGAKLVTVRRLSAFKWANDGSITQTHLMEIAYIVDDQTVSSTDGTSTRSVAGIIVGVDPDGVWVE